MQILHAAPISSRSVNQTSGLELFAKQIDPHLRGLWCKSTALRHFDLATFLCQFLAIPHQYPVSYPAALVDTPFNGMKARNPIGTLIGLIALVALTTAAAESAIAQPAQTEAIELANLSFANLFTAGWDEPWTKRPHPDGAPDMTLLRVQSNLLLFSLRTDYFFERTTSASKDRSIQFANQLIEYSLNRRLMLAVFGNYEWIDGRTGPDRDGGAYGALARLQLVDVKSASYAFNLRVAAPNDGLGEKQTITSFALAGWHDLTPLGLYRVGLYWHIQEETLIGPHAAGSRQNDLTYDLTVAKTWTRPTSPLGNFSTFVEAYAKSDLDGRQQGHTVVTLTPGFRFNVHHHHVFMAGVDIPVSHPRPYEQIIRGTYIYSF